MLLKRSGGAVSKTLQVVAVSASILAAGAAWRYGTAPKVEPLRDARDLAPQPAPSAAGSTEEQPARAKDASSASTWQRSVTVQQLGAPASEPVLPAPSDETPSAQPTVRVLGAGTSEPPPAPTDQYWRALSEPVAAAPSKRPPRPAPSAARPAPHSASRPPSPPAPTAKGEKKSDEYDFGIDEPSAPKGRKSAIRTTLD